MTAAQRRQAVEKMREFIFWKVIERTRGNRERKPEKQG